jgi:hypothetical protein
MDYSESSAADDSTQLSADPASVDREDMVMDIASLSTTVLKHLTSTGPATYMATGVVSATFTTGSTSMTTSFLPESW